MNKYNIDSWARSKLAPVPAGYIRRSIMPRQTSIQLTPDTERKLTDLKAWGYGTTTDIVRIAVSKYYDSEVSVKLALEKMRDDELVERLVSAPEASSCDANP